MKTRIGKIRPAIFDPEHYPEDAAVQANEEQTESPLLNLSKDLKEAAAKMTAHEARFLVDAYYIWQENRIRAGGQIRAMKQEPHRVILWAEENSLRLENQIKLALGYYAKGNYMGRWSLEVTGIGPVIAAGLLANLNLTPWRCAHAKERKKSCNEGSPCGPECKREKIETAGHIWSFAGLEPLSKWEKGELRPWNASLKTLCYKIGESFIKCCNKDNCFYGKLFIERKALEARSNDEGKFSDQARSVAGNYDKSTDAWPWYNGCYPAGTFGQWLKLEDMNARAEFLKKQRGTAGSGQAMLAPAHINARARRYSVKIFLSHWFEAAYRHQFKAEPPKPFALAHLGHVHKIESPVVSQLTGQ